MEQLITPSKTIVKYKNWILNPDNLAPELVLLTAMMLLTIP